MSGTPVSYGPDASFRPPALPAGIQETKEPSELAARGTPPPRNAPARRIQVPDDRFSRTTTTKMRRRPPDLRSCCLLRGRFFFTAADGFGPHQTTESEDVSNEAPKHAGSEEPPNLEKMMEVNFVGLSQEDFLSCLDQGDAFLD